MGHWDRRCQRPVRGMQGSCQLHNAISGLSHCTLWTEFKPCTEQKLCRLVLAEASTSVQRHKVVQCAFHCIVLVRIVDSRHQRGGIKRAQEGQGGLEHQAPNTEMENLNVRKYYHSSQSVFYISIPWTVWRSELGFGAEYICRLSKCNIADYICQIHKCNLLLCYVLLCIYLCVVCSQM